jgi:hypothetical protein
MGMLGVRVRNMKALTLNMETVTLTDKGSKIWHALCIKCMKFNGKTVFFRRCVFSRIVLDMNKYILPWQTCFIVEVIRVILNSGKYGILAVFCMGMPVDNQHQEWNATLCDNTVNWWVESHDSLWSRSLSAEQ